MDDLLTQLTKCGLFVGKSPSELQQLLSDIGYQIATFKKNEIILSPAQSADTMGIILSGSVDVQKVFPSGKLIMITRKTASDLFAEPSVFSRANHYPNQISASKPCRIMFIHQNELLKLFRIDRTIMLNFLKSVSDSMLILEYKIGILSLNTIQAKIATFLYHEYKHTAEANHNVQITLPFSKKIWAESMNVSRTSLARELKKMTDAQIIAVNQKKITIINLPKLERILSD
jgi:CRP-like cAMP-binding protein